MKIDGLPSLLRLVIPAHAGIQVRSGELAWIPAFAGMTKLMLVAGMEQIIIRAGVFKRGHEERTF